MQPTPLQHTVTFQMQCVASVWPWPPALVVLSTENESQIRPVQLPAIRQGHDALLVGGDIVGVQILCRTQTALWARQAWRLGKHCPVTERDTDTAHYGSPLREELGDILTQT